MTEPRVSTRKLVSWVVSGGAGAVLVGLLTVGHEVKSALEQHDARVRREAKREAMEDYDHSRVEYLMVAAENEEKQRGWDTTVITEIALKVGLRHDDLPAQPYLRQTPVVGLPPVSLLLVPPPGTSCCASGMAP